MRFMHASATRIHAPLLPPLPCHRFMPPASVHPSSPLWQVEEVFMAGDLPSVAEILSLMRKSLSLVRKRGGEGRVLMAPGGAW